MPAKIIIATLSPSEHTAPTPLPKVAAVYSKGHLPPLGLTQHSITPLLPQFDPASNLLDGYQHAAQSLIQAAQQHAPQPIAYLVPGDPLVDEASTAILKSLAEAQGVQTLALAGKPLLPTQVRAVGLSPSQGLQILDATLLGSQPYPPIEPDRPLLIVGFYHADLLAPVQHNLRKIYPDSAEIQLHPGRLSETSTLAAFNPPPSAYGPNTFLFLPPCPQRTGMTRFQNTIAHLRAPNGCPWDREQTHHSLRRYLLEETYEVLAALDAGDWPELAEELGDLLLQIVLHAQIGQDEGNFQMTEVLQHINAKMLRRHPHVFGSVEVANSTEVTDNWAVIKAREKAAKGHTPDFKSVLNDIQPALPALAQALEVSKRAVKLGFEWDTVEEIYHKLLEEAQEITTASTPGHLEAEIGDFLFTAVNLARKLNVDAESALRGTNQRFIKRFQRVEQLAQAQNQDLSTLTVAEWLELWTQAKNHLAATEKATQNKRKANNA